MKSRKYIDAMYDIAKSEMFDYTDKELLRDISIFVKIAVKTRDPNTAYGFGRKLFLRSKILMDRYPNMSAEEILVFLALKY